LTSLPRTWTSSSAGDTSSYALAANAINGFTGTVSFSVSGLPAGASSIFNPTTVTGNGMTVLTVTATPSTPAGSYPLTITATSGSLAHTAKATLTVSTAAPSALPTGWQSATIGNN